MIYTRTGGAHQIEQKPVSVYARYFFKRCPNGHMLYWEEGEAVEEKTFCSTCGETHLTHCLSCSAQLGNAFDAMKMASAGKPWSFPKRPAFCGKCGKPFPWTSAEHQRIEDTGFWSLLHPTVVKLARPRFEAGYYADAVESTFKGLNSKVKELFRSTKGRELDGPDLMRKALRTDDPVIVLGDLTTESGRNIQEGYSHIFAGVMQAIRNPSAHANTEIGSDRACHELMLASLLFHQIDERRKGDK